MEDMPQPDNYGILSTEHTIKPFLIQFYEISGDPPVASDPEDLAADMNVVFGGINIEYHYVKKFWSEFFADILAAGGPYDIRFLTNQPDNKSVNKDQLEYLYYENYTNAGKLNLRVDCYDAVQDALSTFYTGDVSVSTYQIYKIAVGYNQLDIDGNVPVDFVTTSYQVFLINDDAVRVSEVRQFYVNNKHYANERYFLFNNSQGGYDTFRTTGEGETNADFKYSTANINVAIDSTLKAAPIKVYNKTNQETFKATTGWKRKAEITWAKEMVNSSRAYEIKLFNETIYFIPIIFTSKKIELFKDKNFLQYMQFEYAYAFENMVTGKVAPWM